MNQGDESFNEEAEFRGVAIPVEDLLHNGQSIAAGRLRFRWLACYLRKCLLQFSLDCEYLFRWVRLFPECENPYFLAEWNQLWGFCNAFKPEIGSGCARTGNLSIRIEDVPWPSS